MPLIAKAVLPWGEEKGSQNVCFYYGVQEGGRALLMGLRMNTIRSNKWPLLWLQLWEGGPAQGGFVVPWWCRF